MKLHHNNLFAQKQFVGCTDIQVALPPRSVAQQLSMTLLIPYEDYRVMTCLFRTLQIEQQIVLTNRCLMV